jgi:hypothetical protein
MDAVDVDGVVRNAFENCLHHHLEHDPCQRGADASVRPEPERDVTVGRPVQYQFVGPVELALVVIGREPADEQLVVAPKLLATEDGVATHSTLSFPPSVQRGAGLSPVGSSQGERRTSHVSERRFWPLRARGPPAPG